MKKGKSQRRHQLSSAVFFPWWMANMHTKSINIYFECCIAIVNYLKDLLLSNLSFSRLLYNIFFLRCVFMIKMNKSRLFTVNILLAATNQKRNIRFLPIFEYNRKTGAKMFLYNRRKNKHKKWPTLICYSCCWNQRFFYEKN